MMMKIYESLKDIVEVSLCFTLIFLGTSTVQGQEKIPSGGINLVNYKSFKYVTIQNETGKVEVIERHDSPSTILKLTTNEQPKFIYNLATNIPLHKRKISKGSILLLSFKAKTEKASLETGEAKTLWMLRQSETFKNDLHSTISISSHWQTYYVPFEATQDIDKKNFDIILQFGFRPQTFLLTDIRCTIFNEGTPLSSMPKTEITYQGMEMDAAWREKAHRNIEKYRKGDFELQILSNGEPLKEKDVSITLIEHDFLWGAALNARKIVESEDYVAHFSKIFNIAVLENALKIKSWSRPSLKEKTLKAIDILEKEDKKIKGHVLIWPGLNYLTKEIKNNQSNPKKVTELIQKHLNNILPATKGKISHWDVVNEAYTNIDLQKITGSEEILYNGFRVTNKIDPKAQRYTNEYGIISKGGIDTKKRRWYYDYIKRIDENTNGLVDGIGLQCHMGSDLTPPETVLDILDFYATLNKKISISEFTMEIKDAELRYQYTKDFITAIFSHPSVSEFLFWGFDERPNRKAVVYKSNWEFAAMGKAFYELAHQTWKTVLQKKTTSNGIIKDSGFYGTYKYTFVQDGKHIEGTFKLEQNSSNKIKVKIE